MQSQTWITTNNNGEEIFTSIFILGSNIMLIKLILGSKFNHRTKQILIPTQGSTHFPLCDFLNSLLDKLSPFNAGGYYWIDRLLLHNSRSRTISSPILIQCKFHYYSDWKAVSSTSLSPLKDSDCVLHLWCLLRVELFTSNRIILLGPQMTWWHFASFEFAIKAPLLKSPIIPNAVGGWFHEREHCFRTSKLEETVKFSENTFS